jgi:hypothetical protein
MINGWMAMEHYRMHVMEQWPEGARKQAGLSAVRSTLAGLERDYPAAVEVFECAECNAKRQATNVIHFPARASHQAIPGCRKAA